MLIIECDSLCSVKNYVRNTDYDIYNNMLAACGIHKIQF